LALWGAEACFSVAGARKVDNLTLIDGKTFLSTTVAGDIVPAGAPDVGFFHDDTRVFLACAPQKFHPHMKWRKFDQIWSCNQVNFSFGQRACNV